MRGRRRAENWLQHKSEHVFTHARSRSGGGAGAKTAPQEMGPTPNLPRPLRNRALQTIIVLKKWQIRSPRPLRVRSASAPRMCEHTRGSGAGMSKSARLRSVTAPRMCERSLWYLTSTYMMTSQHGKAFWITGLLWGESTGHLWISLTKDQKYRRFKLYALKSAQTIVEQPVELPVIWHFCDITIRRDPNILWNTKRGQVCY